ncbi:MAG: hypothetical protein ACT4OV_05125 [Microthrixaceae bacterium]
MTTHLSGLDDDAGEGAGSDRPEVCVLLIEARAGTASVIRSLLTASTAARFTVLRTATIEAGIDAIGFGGVDVVVLGTEVLEGDASLAPLLQRPAAPPIIALTSSDDPSVATRVIDRGLHDCVPASRISADALGWAVIRSVHRVRAMDAAAPREAPSPAASHAPLTQRTVADARTPLTALVDLLELLTSAWDALAEDHKLNMLATIRSYAATVEQLTSDLLSIASIDAETAPSNPQLVSLGRAVTIAGLADTALDVTLDLEPDLSVWVDPDHLARMLTVMLAHAAQRTSSGIVVRAASGGSTVRISLAGADAAPRERVQGWSLLRAHDSSFDDDEGVGLDVARRLAEINGGIAGTDELAGSVWARLPSGPPDADST